MVRGNHVGLEPLNLEGLRTRPASEPRGRFGDHAGHVLGKNLLRMAGASGV
jgi:hypothetical protein